MTGTDDTLTGLTAWRNRITGYDSIAPQTLTANPANFRHHPQVQADALSGALNELGWLQDVVVNRTTGLILDGHLRVELALKHNEPSVPVKYVELSEAEEHLALATLDAITGQATIDPQALLALLGRIEMTAIEDDGLLALLGQMGAEAQKQLPREAVDAEPQVDRASELQQLWGTATGQVWACGEHRLICGDCTDADVVARVLQGEAPNLILADPPYGVNIVATNVTVGGGEAYNIPFGGVKNKGFGSIGGAKPFGSKAVRGSDRAANLVDVGKYAPIIGDETTDTALKASGFYLALYPKAVHVWWGANYYTDGLTPSSCWLVWDKETTGNFADCELAWTNQEKAAKLFRHQWNGMLRDSERERRWHPTQKPAALAAWVFTEFTEPGAIIVDPFAGAGWAVLGGEQAGRKVRAIEMSEDYIAIILQRYQDATATTPHLLED